MSVQEHEEILHVEETNIPSNAFEAMYDDLPMTLTDEENNVIRMLVESPAYLTEEGRVNIQALSRSLDKGWGTTRRLVTRIGEKIQNNL